MYFCLTVWFQNLLCVHVRASSTIPHFQEDEGLSEEERRRMSIEEVRVTDIISDNPVVFEWTSHPLPQTRKSLPIYPYREALLEAITEHQVDNSTSLIACALFD